MVEDKDERLEGGKAEGLEGEGLKVEGSEGEDEKVEGEKARRPKGWRVKV